MLTRIVAVAARRPGRVVVAALAATLLAGLLALRLDVSNGTDVLVGGGTETKRATERYYERFGEDAVYVLVRDRQGGLTDLMLTSDLGRLLGLEGCIGGRPPQGVVPRGGLQGPSGQLAELKPVKAVCGPTR